VIVGSENGNVTMLMNSLRIFKASAPEPAPPRRNITFTTTIQNPWAREMIEVNLTESWLGDLDFVENGFVLKGKPGGIFFIADMHFYDTPVEDERYEYHFYLKFPNTVCIRKYDKLFHEFQGRCDKTFTSKSVLQDKYFKLSNFFYIFNHTQSLLLR
jgi:hypothetical protein